MSGPIWRCLLACHHRLRSQGLICMGARHARGGISFIKESARYRKMPVVSALVIICAGFLSNRAVAEDDDSIIERALRRELEPEVLTQARNALAACDGMTQRELFEVTQGACIDGDRKLAIKDWVMLDLPGRELLDFICGHRGIEIELSDPALMAISTAGCTKLISYLDRWTPSFPESGVIAARWYLLDCTERSYTAWILLGKASCAAKNLAGARIAFSMAGMEPRAATKQYCKGVHELKKRGRK